MTWQNISDTGPSQSVSNEMDGESKQSALTPILQCTERSSTASESLPPITF